MRSAVRPPDSRRADAGRIVTPVFVLVTGLFFLSGSAGLVYQVLWMRSLGLFFGSDMYGVSIILSTFMGGLALGSLLGGHLVERTSRPLMWYGFAELGIGLVALPFARILALFDPLLHTTYPGFASDGAWAYQTLRMGLAVGTLLVPTTLMGATLPLIMKYFVRSRSVLGQLAAYFYAVNTLGALFGTLCAGFLLLPYLGMTRSTWCAATINLAIGAVCTGVGSRSSLPGHRADRSAVELDPLPAMETHARQRLARAALIALGVSGFGSFALEVIWTRILLISFSATVYSFASTLACFLFGIFLGSRLVARIVDEHSNPLGLLAALELGVGVCVGALCVLVNAVPTVFGRLMAGVAELLGDGRDHSLVIATLVASFLLLVLPANLLGATFPVALRVYTTNIARVGNRTGNLYASNTFGAILGSLTAGLVMLPALGANVSLALVALLFAAVGVALALVPDGSGERTLALPAVGTALAATAAGAAVAFLLPYRVALNFNQSIPPEAELVFHAEGVQNTIDVVRAVPGNTALIIGGNVEADDSLLQRRHFVLKGHLPLLLLEEPRSVLVVGLGMGITLQATARHPGVERIDVIELSPEILEAHEYLGDVNGRVIHDPLVHVRIDDGRLFMKLSVDKYDMITADPIHPKISRVGYLYTREYYQSIRDHLNEGGVVCQWMPIYQIAPLRLRSAIKTFLAVFPDATLWYVENHALLIAQPDSPGLDFALLAEKFADPAIREDLESIGIASPEELLGHLLMGPDALRAFVEDGPEVPINSDDFPYLEYFVPGDLFATTRENTAEFVKHLSDPTLRVRNLPPDAAARVRALADGREARLLSR